MCLFGCGRSSLGHAHICVMWDVIPWPGIKPGPPALEVQSLSHWTTREVPIYCFWILNACIVSPDSKDSQVVFLPVSSYSHSNNQLVPWLELGGPWWPFSHLHVWDLSSDGPVDQHSWITHTLSVVFQPGFLQSIVASAFQEGGKRSCKVSWGPAQKLHTTCTIFY